MPEKNPQPPTQLDYATPGEPKGSPLELPILITLTIAPLVIGILVNSDDERASLIWRSILLGFGSVLPWRYAWRGEFRMWAIILGAIYSGLSLLWIVLPLIWH